ncbi:MAG TPA: TlpA disulfide reductase family protein [Puia sp.]
MPNYYSRVLNICLPLIIGYSAASGQVKKGEYSLTVKIEGPPVEKIYFSTMDENFTVISPMDSLSPSNGQFTLKGKGRLPVLFNFFSPDITWREKIIILADEGETRIRVHTRDWDWYQVTGSPATEAYFNFEKEYERAIALFNRNSATLRIPGFYRDTVEGKIKLHIKETYNCYLLKTDTVKRADSVSYSLAGRTTDYGTIITEDKIEMPTGDYIIKRYGDSAESNVLKVVYKHLALNKNTVVGALIAYEHFTFWHDVSKADSVYHILSASAQNTLFGKSLKNYIDLYTFKKKIDFSFRDLTGKKIRLSSLKSQFILVHFWASWCGNCQPQNKQLAKLYQKTSREQLEFINVSFDESRSAWMQGIKTEGLPGFHTSEVRGFDNPIGKLFKVGAVPSTFLLDNHGNILLINPYQVSAIEDKINAIL